MIQSIQWATSNTDSTEWKDFNNDNLAQETMYFKFNLKLNIYFDYLLICFYSHMMLHKHYLIYK